MYDPNQSHIYLKDQKGQSKNQLLDSTIIIEPVNNQCENVSEITKLLTENQVPYCFFLQQMGDSCYNNKLHLLYTASHCSEY